VLRLSGERAEKKVNHWQSVAIAACEQCGGNRVPQVHAVATLAAWLKAQATAPVRAGGVAQRWLLSLQSPPQWLRDQPLPAHEALFLCGPEGGLSPQEEALALEAGFTAVSLGPRVLRAETAALTALAWMV
jgi:16S rRNA (uracil1498-N3)-methyltransferase